VLFIKVRRTNENDFFSLIFEFLFNIDVLKKFTRAIRDIAKLSILLILLKKNFLLKADKNLKITALLLNVDFTVRLLKNTHKNLFAVPQNVEDTPFSVAE